MAARLKIIILERLAPNTQSFRIAFWCDVPVARQPFYASATKTSAWKNATAEDIAALRDGSVVEILSSIVVEPGSALADVQAALLAQYAREQALISTANPWIRYGTSWDGVQWVASGVA